MIHAPVRLFPEQLEAEHVGGTRGAEKRCAVSRCEKPRASFRGTRVSRSDYCRLFFNGGSTTRVTRVTRCESVPPAACDFTCKSASSYRARRNSSLSRGESHFYTFLFFFFFFYSYQSRLVTPILVFVVNSKKRIFQDISSPFEFPPRSLKREKREKRRNQ